MKHLPAPPASPRKRMLPLSVTYIWKETLRSFCARSFVGGGLATLALLFLCCAGATAGPTEELTSIRMRLRKGQQVDYDTTLTTRGRTVYASDGDESSYSGNLDFRMHSTMTVKEVNEKGEALLVMAYPQIHQVGYEDPETGKPSWMGSFFEGAYTLVSFDLEGNEEYRSSDNNEEFAGLDEGVIHSRVGPRNEKMAVDVDAGFESALWMHHTFNSDFLSYPAGEVAPGDSWTAEQPLFENQGLVSGDMRVTLTYTFAGLESVGGKTVAKITLAGKGNWEGNLITRDLPDDGLLQTVEWIHLRHEYDGYYLLDLATGLILDSKVTLALDGRFYERYGEDTPDEIFSESVVTEKYAVTIVRKPWDPARPIPTLDPESGE